jgi:hypothetical protein
VPLEEIFRKFNAPSVIDFFSFDMEGGRRARPAAVGVGSLPVQREMTTERPKQALKDLLTANGYKFLKEISDFDKTLGAFAGPYRARPTRCRN